MRWYNLYIDDKLYCSNSSDNPDGIHIEYNFIMTEMRFTPMTTILLYNASYSFLGSNSGLIGKKIVLEVGMDGYLPTITKEQRGIIFQGRILNALTQTQGVEAVTMLMCDLYEPQVEIEQAFQVKKGGSIADAMTPILDKLGVDYKLSPEVQKLTAPSTNGTKISTLSGISTHLYKTYNIVTRSTQNGLYFAVKGEETGKTVVLQDKDFLKQPELNELEMYFTLQARADVTLGDKVELKNAYDITAVNSTYLRTQAENLGISGLGEIKKLIVGTYQILEVRQMGSSRNPDAMAWSTTIRGAREKKKEEKK